MSLSTALHSIHAQLRAATASAHAALDARFTDGLQAPARYAAYLLGMHRTVAAFESLPAQAATPGALPRTALLRADLDALGLVPLAPAVFALAGPAQWHGARYVIEGSALGAGMLLNKLRAQDASRPLHFLQAHARPGAHWRAVLAALEAFPETQVPALCAGALRIFAVAEDSFARADRRP